MRKIFLLVIGLFVIIITYGQVGINTTNPLGVFHLDPKGDTQGTPNAPINDSDDIVITKLGNMGIGTANPTTKLHIKTAGTATNPISGLMIQDGSEGINKVLVTQKTDGTASWINVPGSWFASMSGGALDYQTAVKYVTIPFTTGHFSKNVPGASFDLANGIIKLPYKGLYKITLSGKVNCNRSNIETLRGGAYIAMLRIYITATNNFGPHCIVNKSFGDAYVSFTYIFPADVGETVQISLGASTLQYANKITDTQVLVEYIQSL